MARRLSKIGGTVYERVKAATGGSFAPAIHLDVSRRVEARLARARKPRRVFIGSMGDMCFEGRAVMFATDGTRQRAREPFWTTSDTQAHVARFATGLPRHTFLLLTKRPDLLSPGANWPRNVHLGVSVTDYDDAHRINSLLNWLPIGWPGIRWASVEPLLDPDFDPDCLSGLGWVVIGAQTGPGAPDGWPILAAARRIVGWCKENRVPCFVKDNLRRWTASEAAPPPWPMEVPK